MFLLFVLFCLVMYEGIFYGVVGIDVVVKLDVFNVIKWRVVDGNVGLFLLVC